MITRRTFFTGLGAVLSAGLLSGCGRVGRPHPPPGSPPPPTYPPVPFPDDPRQPEPEPPEAEDRKGFFMP